MPQKKKHRGFTLIELLIVLLVLGFIMAVIIASITKSKNNGADLQVRETLGGIQVKLSEKEVASGTTNYEEAFSAAGAANQLSALAAKLGVSSSDYSYIVGTNSYAIVFPLKKGGYYCVDYKQAKEVSDRLNTTGTISCDNTVGSTGGGTDTGGGTTNQSPVANAGTDQTITLPTSSVTLSGSGTDSDGSVTSYAWLRVSGTGGTIGNPSNATTTVTGLTAGTYIYRLTVTDNAGATGADTVTITVNNQSVGNPYNGPHTIPGTIQAEDFDNGGEGVAYHDQDPNNAAGAYRPSEGVDIETTSGGGYDVGWTAADEWMKYAVNVTATGSYTMQARVASPYGAKTVHVEMDGTTIGTITIPNTGSWQNWQTVTIGTASLTQGSHSLRLYSVTDGYNIDWVSFSSGAAQNQAPTANAGADQTITLPTNSVTLSGSGSDSDGTIASYSWSQISGGAATIASPNSAATSVTGLAQGVYSFKLTVTDNAGATGTDTIVVTVNAQQTGLCFNCPHNIPGTIQAEDYDTGGEGVSFHDVTAWNSGGASYRNDAVDIMTTTDSTGAYQISYTADGEWLKYSVTVATTGNYTIGVRSSAATGDGYLRMKMDGQFITAAVTPHTDSDTTWTTATIAGVPLTAGAHTLEVDIVIASQWGGMNLNYYTFTYDGASPNPNPAARTLTLRGPMLAWGSPMYFYESLPRGYFSSGSKKYPLLVFLHGAGEASPANPTSLLTGAGVVNVINSGAQLEYTINGQTETFVVLAPQSDWWWNVTNIDKIIEFGKLNYKIDTTRIYLTGLSAGSGGTAKYFGYSPAYGDAWPRKIAAAVLVDGMANYPATEENAKDGNGTVPLNYCYAGSTALPLWLFNASGHYPDWMNSLIATLGACSPAVNMKVTNSNDANSFTKAYAPDHTYFNPNMYEWFLQHNR